MDLLEYQGKQLFAKRGVPATMLGAAQKVVELAGSPA
jgi:succinyl-CoA synthetase beta subunit